MRRLVLMGAAVLSMAGAAAGAPKLGPRHTSSFYGFSLCPPAETVRERRTSATRLVSWVKRDEQTGAVRWTLEVLRAVQKPTQLSLTEYAKAVAGELARTNEFDVKSTQTGTVAGRPAMHFRGVWRGAVRLWRRQTWVQVKPGQHLVLGMTGTEAAEREMDDVLTAVAKTLRLFDPTELRRQRAESLKRGAAVLDKLTDAALGKLLSGQTHYHLMKLKGRTVGFLRASEGTAKRDGRQGAWVVRAAALTMPDAPRQLVCEELFASPERSLERWRRVMVLGRGRAAARSVQEGIKQDNLILLHTRAGAGPRKTRQFEVSEAIRGAYLPAALAAVAPRLIDRSKPTSYGFAVFNAEAMGFDLRTLRVVGPGTAAIGRRRVPATRLIDREADDAPEAEVWVDESGAVLTLKTPEGLSVERADRAAVAGRFAAELLELDKLLGGRGK